jgi:exopolysaccharide biosynthesis polyprenyl glycosylphosphotransferase
MIAQNFGKKFILSIGDIAFSLSAIYISAHICYPSALYIIKTHYGATVFAVCTYILCFYIFDLYSHLERFVFKIEFPRIAIAIFSAGILALPLFYIFREWQFGRKLFLLQLIVTLVLITAWRWLYAIFFSRVVAKEGVLVIGAGRAGTAVYELLNGPMISYEAKGFLDDDPNLQGRSIGALVVLGTSEQIVDIARELGVKTVILAITHDRSRQLQNNILEARLKGIHILHMTALYEHLTRRVPVEHIQEQWFLLEEGFTSLYKVSVNRLKRTLDVLVSAVLLLLFAPILLLTALAIQLDSRGPIFYRQQRVGKDGEVFAIVKFRSMFENSEVNGAVWAQPDDPRITRVGRWIRLLRFDELPQLWNVLRGEMSLIGPRPERPEFIHELEKRIPFYFVRHCVKPGISGWAQVNHPYGDSVESALQKLEYDLYYVKNLSIFLDLKIILKTIRVMLLGEGAR